MPRQQPRSRAGPGFDAKPSVQANGTVQLRSGKRDVVRRSCAALGVTDERSAGKSRARVDLRGPEEVARRVPAGAVRRRRMRRRPGGQGHPLRRSRQPVRGTAARRAGAAGLAGHRRPDLPDGHEGASPSATPARMAARRPTAQMARAYDLRISRALAAGVRRLDRFHTAAARQRAAEPRHRRRTASTTSDETVRLVSRSPGLRDDLQPHRAAQPLLHRQRCGRGQLLRVHAPGQLLVQPGVAQPDEVPRATTTPSTRRRSRRSSSWSSPRWTSRSASRTSRPRRSARPPAPTASSASATPTSARC